MPENFLEARFQAMRPWFSRIFPTTILDLGGRPGTSERLLKVFPDAKVVLANLEIHPGARNLSRVRANGEHLPIRDRSIDLVFCSEVIEHVREIDLFLNEASRILVPGGSFFSTTPNMAAWHNRVFVPLGFPPANYTAYPHQRFGSPRRIQRLHAEVQDHIRVFTMNGLVEALQHHGFQLVEKNAISYAVPGRPFQRIRRAVDLLLPLTWKEDLLVWVTTP